MVKGCGCFLDDSCFDSADVWVLPSRIYAGSSAIMRSVAGLWEARLVVFLLCASLFVACALPVEIGVAGNKNSGFSSNVYEGIASYDLQHFVPVPVAGESPRVFSPDWMSVSVEWTGAMSDETPPTFVEGRVYQAVITLTANEGFSFRADIPFLYFSALVYSQPDRAQKDALNRVCEVIYLAAEGETETGKDKETGKEPEVPKMVIKTIDLTSQIKLPKVGDSPDTEVTTNKYTGQIIWSPDDGVFKENRDATCIYTAAILLIPRAGYYFAEEERLVVTYYDMSPFKSKQIMAKGEGLLILMEFDLHVWDMPIPWNRARM